MSDETFNSLNDLQEYYLSSFHKVFKTINNTSLSIQEKNVLIRCVSRNYSNSFHVTLSSLVNEYSGDQYIFEGNSSKNSSSKEVSMRNCKGKNKAFSKESRNFLERVFERKRTLNSREREAVAANCGLTPIQVRIWFNNRRMRSK
ncbi:a1 transcritional factor [Zygosaccharomyces rouxii]|uniref:A1 transcriptional factor n=3 Tax=Zygosaccharomyces TaxID=4953 RepID=L8B8S7_ZYGRO|nr:a1 transcriptional factor [Zygosaccharomyces rouxii]BBB04551.1 mating type a1 [Zygosaccharomyces sp. NBRC 1876]BDH85270.1 transcription factor [Zygosaccharomyces sp.]BAM78617.1 a1 transcriptional protein [Zygosaccharomyces rouxii]BAX02940.1 a1 transcriptional factor [Zygosaccharomyces rouxii]